jgi:23S rRNA pseudouridine1911/1915/1917 synthase
MNIPESIKLTFYIPESLQGKRLDQAVHQLLPDYSRSLIQQWITKQWLLVYKTP